MSEALEVIQVRRDRLRFPRVTVLMAAGLAMVAAAVCVVLGEKGVGLSESLWNVALDVCRVVTGLLGLLVVRRRSPSRRRVPLTASRARVATVAQGQPCSRSERGQSPKAPTRTPISRHSPPPARRMHIRPALAPIT